MQAQHAAYERSLGTYLSSQCKHSVAIGVGGCLFCFPSKPTCTFFYCQQDSTPACSADTGNRVEARCGYLHLSPWNTFYPVDSKQKKWRKKPKTPDLLARQEPWYKQTTQLRRSPLALCLLRGRPAPAHTPLFQFALPQKCQVNFFPQWWNCWNAGIVRNASTVSVSFHLPVFYFLFAFTQMD